MALKVIARWRLWRGGSPTWERYVPLNKPETMRATVSSAILLVGPLLGSQTGVGLLHAQEMTGSISVYADSAVFMYPASRWQDLGCQLRRQSVTYFWSGSIGESFSHSKSRGFHVALDSVSLDEVAKPWLLTPTVANVGEIWGEPPSMWRKFDGASWLIKVDSSKVTITLRGESAVRLLFEEGVDSADLFWCTRNGGRSVDVPVLYH